MPYGSIAGVKDNLPRFEKFIKPDAQATGPLDIKESTITAYLTTFTALVENALYTQYLLPLKGSDGNTPETINLIVNNLAAHKLASRFHTTLSNEENHGIAALRKDANEILKGLVSGEYALPGVARVDPGVGSDELDLLLSEHMDESFFDLEDPVTWQDKI